MATSCRYEFQCKNFGFTDASPDLFQHLQWSKNRWIFLAYRFFMMAYVVGWFIYAYIETLLPDTSQQLSNWSEGVMVVYFLVAFMVAVYAVAVRNRQDNSEKLSWFYIINWLMFNVASVAAFEITIFYWALIAPGRTLERNLQPVTFHIHVINSVLLLIDIFMVAFPCRLLHFIYTVIYGILYTIFLVILHLTGFPPVYDVLDFGTSPGTASAYIVLAVVVLPTAIHAIVFGLYHLRAFIARKTVLRDEMPSGGAVASAPSAMEMGNVNPAFDETPSHKVEGTLA